MDELPNRQPVLQVIFFKTDLGVEPVRQWLLSLNKEYRNAIGKDLMTAQFGWPKGMPLIRKLDSDLWEVRTRLRDGIARVLFIIEDGVMVLLHGFIKKTQKTPVQEIKVARQRLALLRERKKDA